MDLGCQSIPVFTFLHCELCAGAAKWSLRPKSLPGGFCDEIRQRAKAREQNLHRQISWCYGVNYLIKEIHAKVLEKAYNYFTYTYM